MKLNVLGVLNSESSIIDQVLEKHGLRKEWLEADSKSFHDGSKMRNFQEGWDLLEKHKNGSIYILVDQDYDGYSSGAVMYMWLKQTYPNMKLNYIIPQGKTHGIIDALMPNADECDLLIIPDASCNEVDEHEYYSQFYNILILDHHSFSPDSHSNPYAVVINPHHPDCPYPNKTLSGVGVVYKFIEAIDQANGIDNHTKYLDLVASGMIADMMSVKNYENKAIINIGLKNLTNNFILAYLRAEGRLEDKTQLTPIGVSFYLAPIINSTIRIGGLELKKEVFKAMVEEISAEPIIAEMKKIKGRQDRQKEPAVVRIVRDLQKAGRDKNTIIIAEAPNSLSRSMTGLVAGQLADMYQKPVLLGRKQEDDFVGSGRSLSGSTVEKFREFLVKSQLLNWGAGHSSAFGFHLPLKNIDKLISYANTHLPKVEKTFNVWKMEGDKRKIIEQLENLAPHYSTDFPELLLFDEIYVGNNFSLIGKNSNTLKIENENLIYIKFKHKEKFEGNVLLKIIGKANMNHWNGTSTPQIMIENMVEENLVL